MSLHLYTSKPVIIIRFHVIHVFLHLRVESCHQHNVTLASNRKEMMVHFLLLELETVGNIRFEEGNTGDPWYYFYLYEICFTKTHGRLLICMYCFLHPL